jgi:hypothetical protein
MGLPLASPVRPTEPIAKNNCEDLEYAIKFAGKQERKSIAGLEI